MSSFHRRKINYDVSSGPWHFINLSGVHKRFGNANVEITIRPEKQSVGILSHSINRIKIHSWSCGECQHFVTIEIKITLTDEPNLSPKLFLCAIKIHMFVYRSIYNAIALYVKLKQHFYEFSSLHVICLEVWFWLNAVSCWCWPPFA